MNELKPCPFCGDKECETYTTEEVSFVQNQDLTMSEEMEFLLWGTGCYKCSAQVYGFDTEEEAIEAWNTRAERTCNMVPNGEHGNAAVLACSACGNTESVYAISADDFNYCPNCGAKVVS